jgi:hypothetical protein
MLIKIATDLRVARTCELALGFGAAMTKAILRGANLVELALGLLARLTKIDDIAHACPLALTNTD